MIERLNNRYDIVQEIIADDVPTDFKLLLRVFYYKGAVDALAIASNASDEEMAILAREMTEQVRTEHEEQIAELVRLAKEVSRLADN